jgi:hypothetical protein
MRTVALVLAAAAVLAASAPRTASAEEPPPPATTSEWYGGQLLVADALALGTTMGAIYLDPERTFEQPLFYLGLGMYALGGPILHAVHGKRGRGAVSLGLRLGVPAAAGVTTALVRGHSCVGQDCGANAAAYGVMGAGLAALGVSVLDAVFASEDIPVERSWTPTIAPLPGGGASFGVAGTF